MYDTTGVQYKVPEWVVVEPEGLVSEDDVLNTAAIEATSPGTQTGGAQSLDSEDADEVKVVRARISHNQRDVKVSIRRKETVVSIVEKLKKQAEVCQYITTTPSVCSSIYQIAVYSKETNICSLNLTREFD